ncbi:hypothetical protein [Ornithinibacillus halophilus]|uniref:DUF4190 domain-containing protein n=1 Tax=Ornithinibacillus halophilus TaxID=930117 RepID=A0A1M5MZG1_9BACI|nr:hypothetical protein [Ornithinibacillus halophilus]SHG82710.1 hypothetical protein SAMN05216225_106810 [Ornithinibacillus halophilus]
MSKQTYSWIGFVFLVAAIVYYLVEIYVVASPYLLFYGLILVGLIFSFIGRPLKQKKQSIGRYVGLIGLIGNLVIAIVYFPPFYFIWGTLIFGP